ncbi:hypothetical protein ACQ4LE_000505 [Meloidogyne hapla]
MKFNLYLHGRQKLDSFNKLFALFIRRRILPPKSVAKIVRCFPFKSEYYMNIAYELTRNSIAAVNQFARAHFAGDISPILIQSYNGSCLHLYCLLYHLCPFISKRTFD